MFHLNGNIKIRYQFLSIESPENAHAASFSGDNISIVINPGEEFDIYWPTGSLVSSSMQEHFFVDISAYLQYYNPRTYTFDMFRIAVLKSNVPNDGEEKVRLTEHFTVGCPSIGAGTLFSICPILFKIAISDGQSIPSDICTWSGVAFFNFSSSPNYTVAQCEDWNENANDALRLERLLSCPPFEIIIRSDSFYQIEDMTSLVTQNKQYHSLFMKYFHPTVGNCYRQSV